MTGAPPTWGPNRSFGRIRSRTLKPRQADLMRDLLPKIAFETPAAGPLDLPRMKPGARAVRLEIGFGGGEHLAEQAARAPDVLFLGCEPFLNGVASALRWVSERNLDNVRICAGDARPILESLPDASLDAVFVLFPDPWPKARHHKRRFIQSDTLAEIARALKPGGRLRFATDWRDYAAWTLERALREPRLSWTAERAADWRAPPDDHVTTRYETKRLGDTAPVFLDFVRV